ncbi:MAG: DUF2283 domain-containing protein [Candidatus Sungiibacteriota bacterium]
MKNHKSKKLIHYDRQSDVFYIWLKSGDEEEYVEIAPGVGVEMDENGQVLGIEILNASKVFQPIVKSIGRKSLSPAQ